MGGGLWPAMIAASLALPAANAFAQVPPAPSRTVNDIQPYRVATAADIRSEKSAAIETMSTSSR